MESIKYNDVLNYLEDNPHLLSKLNSYLSENITIGGSNNNSISLDFNYDISDLFDSNGYLLEDHLHLFNGGGIFSGFSAKGKIKKVEKLYNTLIKVDNTFDKMYNEIIDFEDKIKDLSKSLFSDLSKFYIQYKYKIALDYISSKNNSNIDDDFNFLIKKKKYYDLDIKHSVEDIEDSYKEFNDSINTYKSKGIFSKKKKITAGYIYLNNKLNEYTKILVKIKKQFHKKKKKIIKYKKNKVHGAKIKEIINNFEKKINDYDNKIDKCNEVLVNIFNIQKKVDDIFRENTFKNNTQILYDNMFSVYENVDNIIDYFKTIKKSLESLKDLFKIYNIKLQNDFDPKLKDNNFVLLIKKIVKSIADSYLIIEATLSLLKTMRQNNLTYNFPPKNINQNLARLEQSNKAILLTYDLVYSHFKYFFVDDKVVIDEDNIVKFINNVNKIVGGMNYNTEFTKDDNFLQLGGLKTITEPDAINEEAFYLHTYDMYAINKNFCNHNGEDYSNKKTYLRLLDRSIYTNLYNKYIYGSTMTEKEDLYPNLFPGSMMITKEMDYDTNNHILPQFIHKIKNLLNKARPQFITFFYKFKIYTYIINFINSENITFYLYNTIDFTKKTFKNDKERIINIEVYGEYYYYYIPKFKDDDEEEKNKLYVLPAFLQIRQKYPKTQQEWEQNRFFIDDEPNAKFKYDNLYIPIDTLYNKVLIPYIPINLRFFNINTKKQDLGLSINNIGLVHDISKGNFDKLGVTINLRAIDPLNLEQLKKFKFIALFTDMVKIFKNNTDGYINLNKDIMQDCYDYFNDFIFTYNLMFDEVLKSNDINKLNSNNYLGKYFTNSIVSLFNNSLNTNSIKEYYNDSDNYENFTFVFKYIYYECMKDIDITLFDTIKGIDTKLVKNTKLDNVNATVYNFLIEPSLIKITTSGLEDFNKFYQSINNDKFNKSINIIYDARNKLEVFNSDNVNIELKETKVDIVKKIPDKFFNAPTESNSFKKLTELLSQKYKVMAEYNGFILDDLFPGFSQLSKIKTSDERKLLQAKKTEIPTNLPNAINGIDVFLSRLITKEGAKELIDALNDYNARKDAFRGKKFRSGTRYTNEYNIYNDTGKVCSKLIYYINLKIREDEKNIFKSKDSGGYQLYKKEADKYVETIEAEIKEEEEKNKNKKPDYSK